MTEIDWETDSDPESEDETEEFTNFRSSDAINPLLTFLKDYANKMQRLNVERIMNEDIEMKENYISYGLNTLRSARPEELDQTNIFLRVQKLPVLASKSRYGEDFKSVEIIFNSFHTNDIAGAFINLWNIKESGQFPLENQNSNFAKVYRSIISALWNATDGSDLICSDMAKESKYYKLIKDLSSTVFKDEMCKSSKNSIFAGLIKAYLGIIHNILRRDVLAAEIIPNMRMAEDSAVFNAYLRAKYGTRITHFLSKAKPILKTQFSV